ncbi:hypothetical protein FB45DRAFT_200177 [Roridomyces roridus]|uniref:Uncharacterized protein n=1 Tax=Roridomyces roridus TaxID=1738132 RepID=A0AAD7CFU6_9AGAR|nr:hypothetical protein FB45DRAFT_200177 [Roridomyces roridus]
MSLTQTVVLPPLEFASLDLSSLESLLPAEKPPTGLPVLESLASQHHFSTYHRVKYGATGSPARYVPLSIHFPDHMRELQARQRMASCATNAWWPCDAPREPKPLLGPCGIPTVDSLVALRDELQAAMEDQLGPAHLPVPNELRNFKTSSTHPINISAIIPPELIPLISSHLVLADGPTLFDIPPSFALDRLTAAQYHDNSIQPLPPPPPPPIIPPVPTRAAVTEALKAAIDTTVTSVSLSVTVSVAVEERAAFAIGNLFMSSCPGKKVRLQGPVKGRSGVCRDLHADLRRMKDLGVGCVVCCLDDAELEFLGAPWQLYEPAA